MKKIFLLNLCLIYTLQLWSQTEKGMWLMDGKLFSNSTLSTDSRTNEENNFVLIDSEIGLFVNRKNLIGTKLSFQFNYNKGKNLFSQQLETNVDFTSELATFYRFYPFPDKKFGVFGEMQFSLLGNSQNANAFYNQFRAEIGAGAYVFFRKNLAFELSLSKPFIQTEGLNPLQKLTVNFGLVRNFKRPTKTQLPRLEDNYLFVRNFYYGLGVQRSFQQLSFPARSNSKFSINAGLFIGSHWLIEAEYFSQNLNLNRLNKFSELQLSSIFFIKLNKKGTYLRPSASFKLENNGIISRTNSVLLGFREYAYIGKIELAQFLGDQTIIRGGGTFILTNFGPQVDHFQFNVSLGLTYFVNEDFAIEYTGGYFIKDKLVNRTGENLILELSNVNAELKIKHFLFQK